MSMSGSPATPTAASSVSVPLPTTANGNATASTSGSPPRKRRKARRACDPCRARKLRCEYPEDAADICTACVRSKAQCVSSQPAKIDKRRLRALVDLATTEEQRRWVAEQVAQRGVYVASTDKGALRKARPSAAGDPLQLMARLSGSFTTTATDTSANTAEGVGSGVLESRLPGQINKLLAKESPTPESLSPLGLERNSGPPTKRKKRLTHDGEPGQVGGAGAERHALREAEMYPKDVELEPPPRPQQEGRRGLEGDAGHVPEEEGDVVGLPPRRDSAISPTLKTTGLEPRLQGPTASINLLGDLPEGSAAVAKHDRRYGLFRVTDDWVFGGNTDEPMREGFLANNQLREDVVAKLIDFYTTQIAPINPVISPHRVTDAVKSSSLILASVVAVAALSRAVPPEIYANVRHRLKLQLSQQVGGGSTLPQIQAMLITGMSHELHGDTNMEGGSNCWLRIGSAIRQAQDIGLHRLDSRHWLPEMFADRVRAWLGCIITDRWYGGAYGQPLTINLMDCEDPLANEELLQTPDLSHAFQSELFHVSCLLGNIMQTIYRPRGLERCTDQTLEGILGSLDERVAIIDNSSAFLRNPSSLQAGLLNLTISCTEIIFFRSFVKLNRKLPSHLTFRPTPSRWMTAVRRARTAILWMNIHGDVLLDCWLLVKYAITYSALAQYYHFAAERDPESLHSLLIAKDVMNRWALGHRQERPIAARSKIADIVNIFYKAALDLSEDETAHPLTQPPFAPAHVADQQAQQHRNAHQHQLQHPLQHQQQYQHRYHDLGQDQEIDARPSFPFAQSNTGANTVTGGSAGVGAATGGGLVAGPAMDAANALLYMDGGRSQLPPPPAEPTATGTAIGDGSTARFDPSTLDDWLADVFRLHGASDVGFMAANLAETGDINASASRGNQWPEGIFPPL